MPVSVPLDFTPPEDDNIIALRIYEAPTKDGPWVEIERTVDIGAYPSYISHYTTALAVNPVDWFAIAWEDDKGAVGDLSAPIQGGTETLVNKLVRRVLLRDGSLNEIIVTEEVEDVVSKIMGTTDPYDVTLAPTVDQITGMTYLALARANIATILTQSSASYTAGLVSERSSAGSLQDRQKILDYLVGEANKLLGLNYTVVMLLEDIDPTGLNTRSAVEFDASRLTLFLE